MYKAIVSPFVLGGVGWRCWSSDWRGGGWAFSVVDELDPLEGGG